MAGFAAADDRQDQRVLDGFADDFADEVKGQLPSATDVRSYAAEAGLPLADLPDPDRSSDLRDSDRSRELEQKTAAFADKTNALIVLAGLARSEGEQTKVRPAVYIRSNEIANLPELVGWYVGKPIPVPRGLGSRGERDRLSEQLTQQVGDLAKFLDAMETWRTDDLAKAGRILNGLPVSEPQDGRNGFVPPDLVLLFRGTAAEQQPVAHTRTARLRILRRPRRGESLRPTKAGQAVMDALTDSEGAEPIVQLPTDPLPRDQTAPTGHRPLRGDGMASGSHVPCPTPPGGRHGVVTADGPQAGEQLGGVLQDARHVQGGASWEPEVAAISQLIAAHPEEFARLLSRAEEEQRRKPPCFQCACLSASDLELADFLGHDALGHRVLHCLQDSGQIHSVAALRAYLDDALGLGRLRGHGLGDGGLERVHAAMHLIDDASA
ncbi:hypothetical protein AB0M39_38225 [Streptomyces sp. NPDC051907]|uniref:hypothetical protein n=1 Tax=Streptomyces sp. NPDC051907 TaxID=3155284 RepID=UPI0034174F7B